MSIDKQIQADGEHIKERDITVAVNTQAGALVFDDNTTEERTQWTAKSGAHITMNKVGVTKFSPNNDQEQVLGNKYSTTRGDSHTIAEGMMELRPFGDFTLIAGSEEFFNNPIADQWIEAQQEVAAAKAGGELAIGGVGNNTGMEYPMNGTLSNDPNSDVGTVEGGSFETNKAQDNIETLLEKKGGELAAIEKQMGVGGSAKIMTTKHLYLHAGPKPIINDSGLIVENGRSVTRKKVIKNGEVVEQKTGTTLFESKDTSSAVPFGDIHLAAGTKIRATAGSGGIGFNTAGDASFTSNGRTTIGGAEVAIGGGTKNDLGRVSIKADKDVFIQSQDILTIDGGDISVIADDGQVTIDAPQSVFTGNVHIKGDLIVEGNVYVNGGVGIRVPNGDVVASGVSLVNHTHKGDSGGTTSPPN